MDKNDPIGNAIWDYELDNQPEDINVDSDITEEDIIPIDYLFRTYLDFPPLEITAMKACNGKILDVGAGAGPHSKYLIEKGFDVTTVESSPNAHRYLKKFLPQATHYCSSILDFNIGKYDTILLLMNGIGLAGTAEEVEPFLNHLSSLLSTGGSILCESTDIIELFTDDEGGMWVDLNANYYGDFRFNMRYKDSESGWFNWVYVDLKNLDKFASNVGLQLTLLDTDDSSFLVQLKK